MIEAFQAINRFLASHIALRGKVSVVLRVENFAAAEDLRILMNREAQALLPGVKFDAGLHSPSPYSGTVAGIQFEIIHG